MCILAPENSALSFHSYHVPVFRVGEKQSTHPPLPVKWGVCTTHQLTNQLVTWLIVCYRPVGVRDPVPSRSQTLFLFTSLRNYQYQNKFIVPFIHGVGGLGKNLISVGIPLIRDSWLPAIFYMSSSHDGLRIRIVLDRKRSVLFLLNIKQNSNLG